MQLRTNRRIERRGDHQRLLLSVIGLVAIMLVVPAQAQINFTFNYTDAAGVGFNAAGSLGAERRTALEQTGTLLSSFFPQYTATIVMDVNGSETGASTLASAGSQYSSNAANTCSPGYNRGDVGIKILGGADPNPGAADGTVSVNFATIVWDLDDNVDPDKYDFKSTILHELLHAMDFFHSITQTGTDPCGTSAPTAGGWAPYDQHLGNTITNLINSSFVIDTASWLSAVTGGTGNAGVLWRGANAMKANSGQPIPLYSPTVYSNGSSISHLDDDFFTSSALLMEAATGPGPGTRTLSAIEVGMMNDMGFITNTGKKKVLLTPLYFLLLDK